MFPKNDPYRDWFNSHSSFANDPFDWSELFGTPKSPKDTTQEDTMPNDQTNELTEQGRDVLGFYRVLQTIDAVKGMSALDWMWVYNKTKVTEQDKKILAQVFMTFTQDKIRKDMEGKPGAALANALMDMFVEEFTKSMKNTK